MLYETPSMAVFKNRKRFHAAQKSPSESTSNWFERLQNSIKSCEFSRISEYMLIDKFVSGLSEIDFEAISQVPTWPLNDLILVVMGSAQIFDSRQLLDSRQRQANDNDRHHDTSFVKVESTIMETKNEGDFEDPLMQESAVQERRNEIDGVECSAQERKRPLTAAERKRNYINRLKEAGKIEEYKRKRAEYVRRSRIRAMNNERLLAPELQMHLMNQRRQANRIKMKRYRQRISNKSERPEVMWLEQDHESTLDTWNHFKTESEIKQESFSGLESDLDFAATDGLANGFEYEDVRQRETKTKHESQLTSKPVRRSDVVRQNKRSFECFSCALQCSSILVLKSHLNTFHPVEGRPILKCHLCDKITDTKLLTLHLRQFHREVPMHKCGCCAEKFKRVADLNRHLKQIHPEYKPFVCEVCGYSTRLKAELWSHSRTHTGRKDAKCNICNSLFSTSSARSKHMAIHTGVKKYSCEHCGTCFRQNGALKFHLIRIHGSLWKTIHDHVSFEIAFQFAYGRSTIQM